MFEINLSYLSTCCLRNVKITIFLHNTRQNIRYKSVQDSLCQALSP